MAIQNIGLGTTADDGTGDTLRAAGEKMNENFAQLYAPQVFPYVSGRFYPAAYPGAALAVGAYFGGLMNLHAFYINEEVTISHLAFRVAGASATNMMLGIYANNPATGLPTGTPLASIVGADMSVAQGVSTALAANVTLQPGIYWMASQQTNTSATALALAANHVNYTIYTSGVTDVTAAAAANSISAARSIANTYGTFPNLTGATLGESINPRCPLTFFRVA